MCARGELPDPHPSRGWLAAKPGRGSGEAASLACRCLLRGLTQSRKGSRTCASSGILPALRELRSMRAATSAARCASPSRRPSSARACVARCFPASSSASCGRPREGYIPHLRRRFLGKLERPQLFAASLQRHAEQPWRPQDVLATQRSPLHEKPAKGAAMRLHRPALCPAPQQLPPLGRTAGGTPPTAC